MGPVAEKLSPYNRFLAAFASRSATVCLSRGWMLKFRNTYSEFCLRYKIDHHTLRWVSRCRSSHKRRRKMRRESKGWAKHPDRWFDGTSKNPRCSHHRAQLVQSWENNFIFFKYKKKSIFFYLNNSKRESDAIVSLDVTVDKSLPPILGHGGHVARVKLSVPGHVALALVPNRTSNRGFGQRSHHGVPQGGLGVLISTTNFNWKNVCVAVWNFTHH